MNRYHLVHTTEFAYDGPVSESYNEVRLRPMHDDLQTCVSFRLITTPGSRGTSYRDALGNWVHQFNVFAEHRRLKVEAESVVLAHEPPPQPNEDLTLAELDRFASSYTKSTSIFWRPRAYVPHLPQIEEFVAIAERSSGDTVGGFARSGFGLDPRPLPLRQRSDPRPLLDRGFPRSQRRSLPGLRAFAARRPAHPRHSRALRLRIPGSDSERANGARGTNLEEVIGGQASHAWVEAYLPNTGWIGLDPTLGKPVALRHVRIAYGRDYGDVAPVRGVYKGHSGQRLSVDVRVRPEVDDDGRELLTRAPEPVGEAVPVSERPHQPQQQQQQQQQQ